MTSWLKTLATSSVKEGASTSFSATALRLGALTHTYVPPFSSPNKKQYRKALGHGFLTTVLRTEITFVYGFHFEARLASPKKRMTTSSTGARIVVTCSCVLFDNLTDEA